MMEESGWRCCTSTSRDTRLARAGNYVVGRAIGRGNFATVYLAVHQIAKAKVALKAVEKSLIEPESLAKLEREISIMKTLEHPHIVKLYEVMRTERYIYIVTEFCRGGELFEALVERGRITEDDAKRWFHQTCSAVLYCHERGIVHRDLKAENILLDKSGDVKIIDFGFANLQQSDELLNTWCGSPPYAAPELLLGNDYDGTKSDVWSLGVLLYILVTGGFPFPGESVDKLKRAVLSGQLKIPFWVSVECSDLLRKMLVLNPDARFSVVKVMGHRWLHGVGNETKSIPTRPNLAVNAAMLCAGEKRAKLNKTILLYLQQHAKWSEEYIVDEVLKKNYDKEVFPTYEILAEKLRGRKLENGESSEHPRRGSRGSILSGKVNIEPEPAANIIPMADLAQLNLSTDEEDDSDDSSSSESGSKPSSFRKKRRRELRNTVAFDDLITGNRRHTLCASEQLLSPFLNQLNQYATLQQQAQLAALAQQAQLFAPFPGFLPGAAPQFSSAFCDMTRILPLPNYERRSSASDSLYPGALLSGMGQLSQHLNIPGSSKATPATIEEEGHRYLSQRGGKRNTVHAVAGAPIPGGSPSFAARHTINPYPRQAPGSERRSSWASPSVTSQQQSQLERIYKKTLQQQEKGGSDSLHMIKQLQLEFQALGRLCPQSNYNKDLLDSSFPHCTPRISITDENNRSLGASGTFDPIAQFSQQANDIIYGQRPATVIGFSHSAGGSGATPPINGMSSSNVSSPERPLPIHPFPSPTQNAALPPELQLPRPIGEGSSKMYTFALDQESVSQQIASLLEKNRIVFQRNKELVQSERELTHFAIPAHGVDIAVAAVPGEEGTKTHVEMMCSSAETEDLVQSDPLCAALLHQLRMLECAFEVASTSTFGPNSVPNSISGE